jgi:addiction module HigA family antidote
MATLSNIHPGEILQEEFMDPLGLSAYRLAKDIDVPQTRIAAIVHGRRGVTPDTAARLGRYFRTSAEFWLNLQAAYDLEELERDKRAELERIHPRDDIAIAG